MSFFLDFLNRLTASDEYQQAKKAAQKIKQGVQFAQSPEFSTYVKKQIDRLPSGKQNLIGLNTQVTQTTKPVANLVVDFLLGSEQQRREKQQAAVTNKQLGQKYFSGQATKQEAEDYRSSLAKQGMEMAMGFSGGVQPIKKYAASINVSKLKLTPEGENMLRETVESIKPELSKIKGKVLSHNEVIEAAEKSNILQEISTREQQKVSEAALLKTRQLVTDFSNKLAKGEMLEPSKWSEYLQNVKTINSLATEKGRALESLKIGAEGKPLVESLLSEVMKVAKNTDDVLKAAENVNFANPKEAIGFYRQFVKPTWGEVFDEFRYNNMLSNPRSHIRNAFSNMLQSFVYKPATIALEQGPAAAAKYTKGALSGIGQGVDDFMKVMRGEGTITKPDLEHIPTNKFLPELRTIPTKLMEAEDKFFSAIIKQGELARGASLQEAEKAAEYSLFRSATDAAGKNQGYLLRGIDSVTNWLYKMPKAFRWMVPFIRTPFNVAKQMVEYSPAGLASIPGASDKKAQLAKSLIGSAVTAIGAGFAMQDKITLSAPTNPTEKSAFYDSGKKPFSVQIGDKWIPVWYFGQGAFAFLLPAFVKQYSAEENLSKTQEQRITEIAGDVLKFVAGQTPLTGLGNLSKMIEGDIDFNAVRNAAFTLSQAIPFSGLVSYIAKAIDPVFRRPKGFLDSLMADLPIVSKQIESYKTLGGEESKRNITDYLAPYTIGIPNPEAKATAEEFLNVSGLRKQALQESASETEKADAIWEEIKYLDPEEQKAKLAQYEQEGVLTKDIFDRLKGYKKESTWTPLEKAVYKLGPVEEAKYHWVKMKVWPVERQKEYLRSLEAKGLLTSATFKELQKLRINP